MKPFDLEANIWSLWILLNQFLKNISNKKWQKLVQIKQQFSNQIALLTLKSLEPLEKGTQEINKKAKQRYPPKVTW